MQLGLLSGLFFVVVIGSIGIWASSGIKNQFVHVVRHDAAELVGLGEVKVAAARLEEWAYSLALEAFLKPQESLDADRAEAPYEDATRELNTRIAQYGTFVKEPDERRIFSKLEHAGLALSQASAEIIAVARRPVTGGELLEQHERLEAAERAFTHAADELMAFETAELDEEIEDAEHVVSTATFLTLASLVIGALLALVVGGFLAGTITRPLRALLAGTEAVLKSDYAHHVDVRGRDEFGQLASTFNAMTASLRGAIERGKGTATKIADAVAESERKRAEELRVLNEQLAQANSALTKEIAERKDAEALLASRNQELENINRIMMNREERILEIKNEVNTLLEELHQPKRYGA